MTFEEPPARHYETVARAIRFIRANARHQPSLAEIAAAVHLSEHHLQRTFSAWAGISPKRFLQFLTKEHARAALRRSEDLLSVTLETGLSSPGRLHDLMVSCEAMTPGEVKRKGAGLTVGYGVGDTPFGPALIAWTPRGVCHLAFDDDERALCARWPAARMARDDGEAERLTTLIFPATPRPGALHLLLHGTNFQLKVWEALLTIPPGRLLSYGQLARSIGRPKAHRSVAHAVAANPIGLLIPCHRVIRGSGEVGEYHWGSERKAAIQAWEAARRIY